MADSTEVQLKRGVLELCVLAYLAAEDNYAYEIATFLAKEIGMGEGTIYPLVRRMQSDGLLDDYLERAWQDGRDRRTGLFTSGGIGSYDRNPTIDHAGLTQLYAFRAWPQERWAAIC